MIHTHGHMTHTHGHMIHTHGHMIHTHGHMILMYNQSPFHHLSLPQIASKCYRFRNYNSLKAILAGLQCTPIYRLKKTWKEVPSKRRK